MVRGAVIGIKENDYFQAAQAIGERTFGTLLRHVLPNIMAPIIVIFSITIGGIIVAEASLSFLGFGLPPGVPSWGGMLSREGIETIAETFFSGIGLATPQGTFANSKMGVGTPFEEWPEEIKQYYRYDPERAKQLLAEAGYPDRPTNLGG